MDQEKISDLFLDIKRNFQSFCLNLFNDNKHGSFLN